MIRAAKRYYKFQIRNDCGLAAHVVALSRF